MTRRRVFLQMMGGAAALALMPPRVFADTSKTDRFLARMASLEARHGGQLGVSASGPGLACAYRGDTRFQMCSTVKLPLVALVLSRVAAGDEHLDRWIDYRREALVTYSPETEQHVDTGMTLGAICRAGLTQSDNTAANLMFQAVGGPSALTAFIRSLGDEITRSDRLETALNEPTAHDLDTTTPNAMRALMARLLVGDALDVLSRDQLLVWMRSNQTGDQRLRAGLPAAWRVGDKTGTGGANTAADLAIAHPPTGTPILIAAYYTGSSASPDERDQVLADVGRAVTAAAGDLLG